MSQHTSPPNQHAPAPPINPTAAIPFAGAGAGAGQYTPQQQQQFAAFMQQQQGRGGAPGGQQGQGYGGMPMMQGMNGMQGVQGMQGMQGNPQLAQMMAAHARPGQGQGQGQGQGGQGMGMAGMQGMPGMQGMQGMQGFQGMPPNANLNANPNPNTANQNPSSTSNSSNTTIPPHQQFAAMQQALRSQGFAPGHQVTQEQLRMLMAQQTQQAQQGGIGGAPGQGPGPGQGQGQGQMPQQAQQAQAQAMLNAYRQAQAGRGAMPGQGQQGQQGQGGMPGQGQGQGQYGMLGMGQPSAPSGPPNQGQAQGQAQQPQPQQPNQPQQPMPNHRFQHLLGQNGQPMSPDVARLQMQYQASNPGVGAGAGSPGQPGQPGGNAHRQGSPVVGGPTGPGGQMGSPRTPSNPGMPPPPVPHGQSQLSGGNQNQGQGQNQNQGQGQGQAGQTPPQHPNHSTPTQPGPSQSPLNPNPNPNPGPTGGPPHAYRPGPYRPTPAESQQIAQAQQQMLLHPQFQQLPQGQQQIQMSMMGSRMMAQFAHQSAGRNHAQSQLQAQAQGPGTGTGQEQGGQGQPGHGQQGQQGQVSVSTPTQTPSTPMSMQQQQQMMQMQAQAQHGHGGHGQGQGQQGQGQVGVGAGQSQGQVGGTPSAPTPTATGPTNAPTPGSSAPHRSGTPVNPSPHPTAPSPSPTQAPTPGGSVSGSMMAPPPPGAVTAPSPLSSLPSHMAPPRPPSSASQRAGSPMQNMQGGPPTPQQQGQQGMGMHQSPVMQNMSTPPPHQYAQNAQQMQQGHNQSPVGSVQSHHSYTGPGTQQVPQHPSGQAYQPSPAGAQGSPAMAFTPHPPSNVGTPAQQHSSRPGSQHDRQSSVHSQSGPPGVNGQGQVQGISVNGQPAPMRAPTPQQQQNQQHPPQPPPSQSPMQGPGQYAMPGQSPQQPHPQGYGGMGGYGVPGFGQPGRPPHMPQGMPPSQMPGQGQGQGMGMGGGGQQGVPNQFPPPGSGFNGQMMPRLPPSGQPSQGMGMGNNGNMPNPANPNFPGIPQSLVQVPWKPGDYPFDPRFLPMIQQLGDPEYVKQQRIANPGMLAGAENAMKRIQEGEVKPEVVKQMQNALGDFRQRTSQAFAMIQQQQQHQSNQAQQHQQHPQHQQQQHQGGSAGQTGRGQVGRPKSSGRQASGSHGQANGREKKEDTRSAPTPTAVQGSLPSAAGGVNASAGPSSIPLPQAPPPPPIPAAPDWPPNVRPNPIITSVSALPFNEIDESTDPTFAGALPAMTTDEIARMAEWLEKDKTFVLSSAEKSRNETMEKMKRWTVEHDRATPWWSLRQGEPPRRPMEKLKILWARDRPVKRRPELRFTPKQFKAMAKVEDLVVPVRLDLEHDQHRLKDTFMWNVSDTVVSPELFAEMLCADFSLPPQHFVSRIVTAIAERVREYKDQVLPLEPRPVDACRGRLEPGSEEWEAWRRARLLGMEAEAEMEDDDVDMVGEDGDDEHEVHTDEGAQMDDSAVRVVDGDDDADGARKSLLARMDSGSIDGRGSKTPGPIPAMERDLSFAKPQARDGGMDVDEIEVDLPMTVEEAMDQYGQCDDPGDDLRILIKVDILVGTQNLSDSFEWDLSSPVTPEDFAALHCKELGLSGEFATALAHDIHEQVLVHKRSLFLVGHAPGSGYVQDDDVRSAFLAPITTALRKEDVAMASFTPIFTIHTEDDILMLEKERERDMKRKKRGTRGRRGVALPERDPIKTQRTLVNPLGANGLLSVKADESAAVTSHAAATATGSRRAAAIAAQANINLLAQDLPIPDKPPPSPHHVPTRGGRGRGRGRGISRASPANWQGREGSVSSHLHAYDSSALGPQSHGTPTAMGPPGSAISAKRSLREDSTEVSSPVPRKRHHASRVPDSPTSPEAAPAPPTPQSQPVPVNTLPDVPEGEEVKPVILHIPQLNGQPHGNVLQQQPHTMAPGFMPGLGKSVLDGGNSSRATSTSSRSRSPEKPQPQNDKMNGLTLSAPTTKHSRSRSETASSGSDSDSDSSDDDYGATPKAKRGKARGSTARRKTPTPPTAPAAAAVAAPPPVPPAPAPAPQAAAPQKPEWIVKAEQDTNAKFPLDRFSIIPKAGQVAGAVQEWRIKCLDCPAGKVYNLGPGETLDNFAIHLKNRVHTGNREQRQARGGR